MSSLIRLCGAGSKQAVRCFSTSSVVQGGATVWDGTVPEEYQDKTDMIGYGVNGQPVYYGNANFPAEAIRFQPDSDYVKSLRVKEAGDWKALTIDEKKELYRTAYQLTVSEQDAHKQGSWKLDLGYFTLVSAMATIWLIYYLEHATPLPLSCHPDFMKVKIQNEHTKTSISLILEHEEKVLREREMKKQGQKA